ncbi:hypothetical protein J5N97_012086 [Dioscorea zingiberensis]|uniref:Bulb-type lectin domain-containing protein n=1 Tax=Dioscorea zingiberensis TaxID=325984 RepID=A0A9D5CP66_9LILI|nr:hypothetical protein J5N97_012086 [Dioscorea zingiberensis]
MPLFLLFLVIILQPLLQPCETATASGSDDCQISTGSILSPSSSSWFSPSSRFAFGFHPEGDGFTVGILFIMAPNNTTTLIWNHNRDNAPVSNSATLNLTADGLMLKGSQDSWLFSDNSSSTHCASMLNSGNFVIFNSNNSVLWQTFDHPTDTIMVGQTLQTGKKIISSVSETNHSSGKFHLRMQSDNNLVMYLRGYVDGPENAYWSSNTYSKQVTSMSLDKDGVLYLSNGNQSRQNLTNGDGLVINNTAVVHRARIEPLGLLQIYSHDLLANTSRVVQRLPDDQCTIKGFCGHNSYCILSEDQTTPQCPCLPGFEYTNPNSQYEGCKPSFIPSYCPGNEPAGDKDSYYTMQHVVFNDDPIAPLKTFKSSILSPSSTSSWFSPSGRFAFGFYPQGNGFSIGTSFFISPDNTIITWTANRDDPPVSKNTTLILAETGLMLTIPDASESQDQSKSLNDISSPVYCASMLDSGKLVIYDSNSTVLWDSFNDPTDTLNVRPGPQKPGRALLQRLRDQPLNREVPA